MFVFIFATLLVPLFSCLQQQAIEDITSPPQVRPADEKYADVFKLLDGKWRGKFQVMVDERGQTAGPSAPEITADTLPEQLPLHEEMVIDVEQRYISETPYFQRVVIKDTYRTSEGEIQTVESHGVNKVQNGQLWCVVLKPDETVIHSGSLDGSQTIIWQRKMLQPLKIEYFRETVLPEEYSIVGWGYYGQDDPQQSPRHWFRGLYRRVRQ